MLVKVLSVRQPWVMLIILGYKDIENRTWESSYRGELYIHASKKIQEVDWQRIQTIMASEGTLQHFRNEPMNKTADSLGGIIGKVQMVDCVTESDSPWFEGKFGFVFENPETVPFIPLRGQQRIFNYELEEK